LKLDECEILNLISQIIAIVDSGDYIFCDTDETYKWSKLYGSDIYIGLKSKDLRFNLDISITSEDKQTYSVFVAGFEKEYCYSSIPTRRLSLEKMLENAEPSLKVFMLFNLDIFGEDYGF
jgi:hypothetical protein